MSIGAPIDQGFYMPAEWEQHEGTWLQWPHDRPEKGLQLKVERTWLTMVEILHTRERLHIAVCDDRQRDHVTYQSGLTPAVYTNYYVANGVVLVPVFGNASDERAKAIIAEQFPDRDVVGVECVSLAEGGGMIHCVTQQQPLPPRR